MWPDADTYRIATWLFLRGLGLVSVIAFVSLMVQLRGLYGRDGLAPVRDALAPGARRGLRGMLVRPTLFWLRSDDWFAWLVAAAGLGGALLLLADVTLLPALALTWLAYLSFVTAGGRFLSYQWDVLLLDALVLAVPLAAAWPPAPPALVAAWFVALRFVLDSGLAKLRSGDRTWRDGTALSHHFETQPLPTRLAWYAHRLPGPLLRAGTYATLAVEIGLPVVAVVPGQVRLGAVAGMALLQVAILLTGNYGFFNLLALVLLVPLLDDGVWDGVAAGLPVPDGAAGTTEVAAVLAGAVLAAHAARLLAGLTAPWWIRSALSRLAPFRVANRYGLFAVMTTSRPEILLEGHDGSQWRPYRFRWKPGDLHAPPRLSAPHQPRLDWQMWFAALRGGRPPAWLRRLARLLLERPPAVVGLLAEDPFGGRPPRSVRAWLYDYRFTDAATRAATGRWWQRTRIGPLLPPTPPVPDDADRTD